VCARVSVLQYWARTTRQPRTHKTKHSGAHAPHSHLFLHLTYTLKPKSCSRTHIYHKHARKSITNSYSFCKSHLSRVSGRNLFGWHHYRRADWVLIHTHTLTHKHISLSLSLSLSHTHTHARTNTHTNTHTNRERETATCENA
jgi:hypothetical protein